MTLIQAIKEAVERRSREQCKVTEEDGPFRYRYTAICQVSGSHFPKGFDDPFELAEFPDVGARAYLSEQWDRFYAGIDTGNAVSTLILTNMFGGGRRTMLSKQWMRLLQWVFGPEWMFERRLEGAKEAARKGRLSHHSGSSCALVYVAEQPLEIDLRLDATRRISNLGVAIDAIEKGAVGKIHQAHVRALSTAVSIAMNDEANGSPDVKFLAHGVELLGRDGLVMYPRTMEAGGIGVLVSGPPSEEAFANVEEQTRRLAGDRRLAVAASLFALSQHRDKDNLRSFMAAWSALEFLTNTLEKRYRDVFREGVEDGSITPPDWDKDLLTIERHEYRLKDVFFVVAACLRPDEAEDDVAEFASINKIRGDFYHRLDVDEQDLPTTKVQNLFRAYMSVVLSADPMP